MKKLTFLLSAFILTGVVKAQDSVTLDMQLLPNKTYKQVSNQEMTMNMSYGGGSQIIDMTMAINGDVITKKASQGKIPLTMKINMAMNMTMEGMSPTANQFTMEAIGNVKEGEFKPVFDSINAPGMPAASEEEMSEAMNKVMEQISLPKKTVKTGESFVQDTPIEVPAGQGTITLNDKITYTLKKVEGNKAYFDILHDITLNIKDVEGKDLQGSGKGTGEMVYDIAKKYPVINNGNLEMEMSMQGGAMQMKITTKTTQTSTIN